MLVGPKAEALGERVVHDSHVHGSATYISDRAKTLWVWTKACGGWDVESQMGEVKCLFVESFWADTEIAQTYDFSGFTPITSPSPAKRVPSSQRSSRTFPVCPVYYISYTMGCWLFTATVAGPCHCQHVGCQFDGFLWPRFWEVIKRRIITHGWVKQLVR